MYETLDKMKVVSASSFYPMIKKFVEKSRECRYHTPQPTPIKGKGNAKNDCKVHTLALEIITPLNECTGRILVSLFRFSTLHKHNRRDTQKSGDDKCRRRRRN